MLKFHTPLILLLALILSFQAQAQPKAVKKLPDFSFFTLNGDVYTSNQVKYDNYLMVAYFDPDCDHCNEQAAKIKENIGKLKNVTMIWISFGESEAIAKFQKTYFDGIKRFTFLQDPNMKIFTYFPDAVETPTVYLYDKNKTQIGKFVEEEVQNIYQFIQ